MTRPKIVFFDIDGTLHDRSGIIPESAERSIKQLISNGHFAVICTGRNKSIIKQKILDLGFHGIIGGCGTYVEFGGRELHNAVLPEQIGKHAVSVLHKTKVNFFIESPDFVYLDDAEAGDSFRAAVKRIRHSYAQNLRPLSSCDYRFSKITGYPKEDSDIEALVRELQPEFQVILHPEHCYNEIMPAGYSKASGINILLSHLGLTREDSYAFGDSRNDLEMFDAVSFGIAMGNSPDEVKRRAAYETLPLLEDGIEYGLKKFGLI
ncbi:Cof-type HAD-IIB family hydrolase [Anaerostipes sp.]|uniref:Cof-type HAD-IIB family hydrolase n=1 Tax=Anaerostipes sp. TaxID=1872530 RepID=UPI0025C5E42F|nr:Cof-type HAD-IIB family hydrolase [Anaerostipes sp.]MBS7008411.1 Cof-type HAD-IIB family hydrolase [Anaerostipes sp.]